MTHVELKDRFANMWKMSRENAGKSQEYMAKALGVSKKTVQNWEAGLSSPSQQMGLEWFNVIGVNPLPYYMQLYHPEVISMHEIDSESIDAVLLPVVKRMPLELKKALLFVLVGNHNSSVVGILELILAHLQTPLRDRLNIASNVISNYKIAKQKGQLVCPEGVQPDIAFLQECVNKGTDAVIRDEQHYVTLR